jgi:hypothetical protein
LAPAQFLRLARKKNLVFSFLRQITILIGEWLISTTTDKASKTAPIFRITQKELGQQAGSKILLGKPRGACKAADFANKWLRRAVEPSITARIVEGVAMILPPSPRGGAYFVNLAPLHANVILFDKCPGKEQLCQLR